MSAGSDDRIVLRSYRLAFELERRIHRIDRFRIPLPYGLPLEALGYGAAVLVLVVLLRQLPVLGALLDVLPLPAQLVFLPGAAAHLLCRTTEDRRPVHEVLAARALRVLHPSHLIALEPVRRFDLATSDWTQVGDERRPTLVAGVVRGPAEVVLRQSARAALTPNAVTLEAMGGAPLDSPRTVRLERDQRLVIR